MDGKTLKRRRLALGYSPSALAKRWGVHLSTVYGWESGRYPIEYPGMAEDALARMEEKASAGTLPPPDPPPRARGRPRKLQSG